MCRAEALAKELTRTTHAHVFCPERRGRGGNTPNTRYAAFCKVTGKVYAQEPRATHTPRRERPRVMEKQKEKKKNGAHCSYLGGCYSGGKHATRGSELDGPG